ncbi:Protein kinase-like domain [Cordyceps militaris CM01]|uniref:Protein kinase-like domain n=1 Tax=Cordyceps militaris (strain CM01) TaxID=983644 RepID=G3JPM5_CORMM|nr:Protein kinase-like domain [Cordyceps militaris CM01]EGX89074.1 Protein kinase-like domain [Cordyceps militaris CM01]
MAASPPCLHVQEVWGESAAPDAAKTTWERKRLELTAFRGYLAFFGTLSLSERGKWIAGTYNDLDDATFNGLLATMSRIPDADIYPLYEDGLTQFDPNSIAEDKYFLKPPNVSGWDHDDAVAKLLLFEAWNNELFLSNPHPHLGAYLGCVVHDGRIVRLAFPKYAESLEDRINKARSPGASQMTSGERKKCMQSIREAVAHLHSLGYAHNDISATNIMFDEDDRALLIDLDSCASFGNKIQKGGIAGGWRGPHFWAQSFEISSVECDEASLRYIEDWLSTEQIAAENADD